MCYPDNVKRIEGASCPAERKIKMKNTTKFSLILVFVIAAMLSSVIMPVFADETKTELINEAKASFVDLYETINPSVAAIHRADAEKQMLPLNIGTNFFCKRLQIN